MPIYNAGAKCGKFVNFIQNTWWALFGDCLWCSHSKLKEVTMSQWTEELRGQNLNRFLRKHYRKHTLFFFWLSKMVMWTTKWTTNKSSRDVFMSYVSPPKMCKELGLLPHLPLLFVRSATKVEAKISSVTSHICTNANSQVSLKCWSKVKDVSRNAKKTTPKTTPPKKKILCN